MTVYETGSSEPSGIGELGLAVNQVPPRTVGGLVMPTNELEILAPYLALVGLVVAVSVVVVVKRRRD